VNRIAGLGVTIKAAVLGAATHGQQQATRSEPPERPPIDRPESRGGVEAEVDHKLFIESLGSWPFELTTLLI
jgi:hypothetical protein